MRHKRRTQALENIISILDFCNKTRTVRNISVSPNCLSRALRIMNALIKALEARGFEVSVERDQNRHPASQRAITRALLLGVSFRFSLLERIDRTTKTTPCSIFDSKYEYRPSGRLTLRIDEYVEGQKCWSDGTRQHVEDCLNEFIAVLIEQAAIKKAEQAEWQRRRQLEEEQRRRQEEAERRRKEEEARVQALVREAGAWERSRQIRAYIKAVKERAVEKEGRLPLAVNSINGWLGPSSRLIAWIHFRALMRLANEAHLGT